MAARRTAKQKRYDETNALEQKLRKMERALSKMIDEAREAGIPASGVSKVQDAWIAVMNAKTVVSRVGVDVLLNYSDDAVERRADIMAEGLNTARLVEDIHEDMARVPKDYEVGDGLLPLSADAQYIQNMFGRR